jgi:transposase InsO family protein
VRRILTDNGAGYLSRSFRATCRALHTFHRRTRPYTPRTNGKAERFIQTALREWAYRRPYYTSADRARVLPGVVGALQFGPSSWQPGRAAPSESLPRRERPHARSHLAAEQPSPR